MKQSNIFFLILLMFLAAQTARSQAKGNLSGTVTDSRNAAIAGATVSVSGAEREVKNVVTGAAGEFSLGGLAAGKYIVRATAPKFSSYENANVEIKDGETQQLVIVLAIDSIKEEVVVNAENSVSTASDSNLSATVLKNEDLDALPDDPDDLEAALQALAGASAGPNGGQFYIDGFTGGRLPPKEAIREIRINSNPFSAEYDRMGFGRIEILTKPGSDKFRGSAALNYNDARLNSRNPFALNRAPAQTQNFSGYLSGPLKKKKASFFLDVSRSRLDRNSIVIATVLDPSFNIVGLNQDYKIPSRRFSFSPRIDYQLNEKNTLVARYSFSRSTAENQGVSGFSLLSRGYDSSDTQHNIQLTETLIVNARTINETRFQDEFFEHAQNGDNSIPTINVSSAFVGGGSQIGKSFNRTNRWELQNYTTASFGENFQHAVKFGVRARGVKIRDHSESGYGGSFSFAGIRDAQTGAILYSSIEQYRQKLLGNPNPIFNPNQFSLTTGTPDAGVSQIDYGVFLTDDWRARRNLTLSLGLRYENQTNLRDDFNFAPRVGIAWSPATKDNKAAKTVFRGAFGIFYERFGENTVLRSRRNDGVSQLQYYVSDSSLLGQAVFTNQGVKNVPTAAQLKSLIPLSSTPFRIAGDLRAPRSFQTVVSVERALPSRSALTATFFTSRSLHTLRQRNINAPVCPNTQICPTALTFQQILPLRPNPASGNIYQVESSGISNSRQLLVKFNTRFNPKISFYANYTLSFAKGTTESFSGAGTSATNINFPAYSYDLNGEYAPLSFVARHNLNASGTVSLPFEFRLSPTVVYSSGRRFNIVTGLDSNHDSVYTERPTFAALRERCLSLKLNNDFCAARGISDFNAVIPRNYGKSSGSLVVNLNLSKSFGFGTVKAAPTAAGRQTSDGKTIVKKQVGGSWLSRLYSGERRKPYNFTLGLNVQNLFNNVNLSAPQGNLSSPFFGRSVSTGGSGSYNRRADLSLRFNF